ncbi:vacuolar protein sorting-associated protein 16 homolog [Stegostoma tigrinum]|uniref:vacuolar protein sorting-associated protein 16 homolog n=1 Tax=Stegostoma tigrinum TaxID=3053191 RepID=UPI00202B08E0|nr:vacuolar protein sorting-associated protein 16 homolog [Stegostoma tigrinum]
MAFVTANWNPFGKVFYRKFNLYSDWKIKEDLSNCLIAAAPYAGPIALINGSHRERSPSLRPVMEIYSSSGNRIVSLPWKSGHVVHIGWTTNEDLLCIQDDGTVLIHDIFGSFKRHFSMGNEVLQNRVVDAKVFPTAYGSGVVILTGAFRFTLATNIDDLKLRRFPEVPGLLRPPTCWAVLMQDRQPKIVLANGKDLYILDNASCTSVIPPGLGPQVCGFTQIAVSFNYKRLALYTDTGDIWMGSSSFKDKLCVVETNFKTAPKQFVWCDRSKSNNPTVVGIWDKVLFITGESNETIKFYQDEDIHLVPEVDGVRIISPSNHEFLHEVPPACQDIFKIASMAPGALLLEAHKEYEKESQKADEYLREIKEQNLLFEAVQQCIEAAGNEYEPEMQKSLLRAASFGKCFISNYPPDTFVKMARDLRVLNAMRDYTIGIPLTYPQYKQLTIEILIDRLILRRLYPLAIRICKYMKISELQGASRILAHWACYKVQQKEEPDDSIARAINHKLGDTPGISYSEIAAKAYECGRIELAIKLLEYEPKSGEQVPLLLKMKRSQLALLKAIESGDSDLVYTVVTYLKNEMNRGDFFMTLQNQPVALSLYRQFCKHQEPETLKDLFNQDDNHQELGNFYVRASYSNETTIEGRVAALQSAVDEYNKAKNEFAAKITEEQIKLVRYQFRLQKESGKTYLDLSLHDTVQALLLESKHKQAEQLYKDFKIPDKRFWWLKISALAEKEDWEELEKFSKSKKSPIGYMPFVEICVKHRNKYEAKKYVAKVSPEQKVKGYIMVGDLDQAVETATERKNESELNIILSKCTSVTDQSTVEKINRAKAQILKK